MATVAIYGLLDPRTQECRYVGKSKHTTVRMYQHVCASQLAPKTHRNHWLKQLLSLNLRPVVVELERALVSEWQEAERFWIAYLKFLGANLTNGTAGGDGLHDPSPETRKKIGDASRGKQKTFSPEHRAKITAACQKRAKDPEWRANISRKLMGNKNNPYGRRGKP